MRRLHPLLLAALTAMVAAASGCFHARDVGRLRHEIDGGVPGSLERKVEFTFGQMSMGSVRLLTAFLPSLRQERGILKEIDRIGVGFYRIQGTPPAGIDQRLRADGWEVVIRARERGEAFWLLHRADDSVVRDFFWVALEDDELAIIHMEGRLEELVAHGLAMEGGFAELFRDHDRDGDGADATVAIHGRKARNATLPDFWEIEQEVPLVRYNRVDGLYLGIRIPPVPGTRVGSYGELGYAFGADAWRYQLGVEWAPLVWLDDGLGSWVDLEPATRRRLQLGAEAHLLTASKDEWVISEMENTLSSLVARRDFRDHYLRRGYSLYARYRPRAWLQGTARLTSDDHESLANAAGWSLFDGGWVRSRFRQNPAVDEIRVTTAGLEVAVDTRESRIHPGTGWQVDGRAELSGAWLDGESDFQRYRVHVRRYQTLSDGGRLDLRARAATSGGDLPRQYFYELGGFSTLRGYGFQALAGDRMLLGNAEVWVDVSRYWNRHWILDGVNVGAFVDAGSAWFGDSDRAAAAGHPGRTDADLEASAGWALDIEDFRVHVARRLEGDDDGWETSFRVSRTF